MDLFACFKLKAFTATTLFLLGGCTTIPTILFGPAGKDAIIVGEQVFDAIEDKANAKAHWHNAAEKAMETGIEAGEGALGVPGDVTIDIWNDGNQDINQEEHNQ